jgi:hypothetical protein
MPVAVLFLFTFLAAGADDDFSIQVYVNGEDLAESETIIIDPDRELTVDLHIFDVTREINLERVSVSVIFAGQTVYTVSEPLSDFNIAAGEDYRERITINIREALALGDLTLVTGIYRTRVQMDYVTGEQSKEWSESRNIRITGNPLSTPLGAVGVMLSGIATATLLMLVKALVSPGLAAGMILPAGTPAVAVPRLYDFVSGRLESTARGRVMSSIVKAAGARIIKGKCPICGTRIKHGYCYTCKKSVKEVNKEYVEKMRDLAVQGGNLLASGQAATLGDLCTKLGVSPKLGTDVLATLKSAKLVKVKGIAHKLVGKAIVAGISSGLSTVLWVTVGGLVVLSTSALVGILVAATAVPIIVAKSLQVKAKRVLTEHAN